MKPSGGQGLQSDIKCVKQKLLFNGSSISKSIVVLEDTNQNSLKSSYKVTPKVAQAKSPQKAQKRYDINQQTQRTNSTNVDDQTTSSKMPGLNSNRGGMKLSSSSNFQLKMQANPQQQRYSQIKNKQNSSKRSFHQNLNHINQPSGRDNSCKYRK